MRQGDGSSVADVFNATEELSPCRIRGGSMLTGKLIVIGVTGGIAAYKSAEVVRSLKKLNASVYVIMTENASEFITPLTLQTLSQNPVITNMFKEPFSWEIEHISLAQKADMILVAPATANIIGKIANGIADDMLSTTIMATKAPVLFASAMNTNMYENPILQENIQKLEKFGYYFIEPSEGDLACGKQGKGRLADIEDIIEEACKILLYEYDLSEKTILITAGPTREKIDPVRFITNNSSGKMGYALAKVAAARGAKVILISGPVNLKKPNGVELVQITSAQDMYHEVLKRFDFSDIVIKAAAVADYKPKVYCENKMKKSADHLSIELEINPDILKTISSQKGKRLIVGFSMETQNLVENSLKKLKEKNLDIIVANDLTTEGAGFGTETNTVKIINKLGVIKDIPLMSKEKIANIILNEILKLDN